MSFIEDFVKKSSNSNKSYLEELKEKDITNLSEYIHDGITFLPVMSRQDILKSINPNKPLNFHGIAGAGKTVAQKMLIEDSKRKGEQIIIIDEHREFSNYVRRLGGKEYNLSINQMPDYNEQIILINVHPRNQLSFDSEQFFENIKKHFALSEKYSCKKLIVSELNMLVEDQKFSEEMLCLLKVIYYIPSATSITSMQGIENIIQSQKYIDFLRLGDNILFSSCITQKENYLKVFYGAEKIINQCSRPLLDEGEGFYIKCDIGENEKFNKAHRIIFKFESEKERKKLLEDMIYSNNNRKKVAEH